MLEVIEEGLGPLGQDRQRRIGAHRSHRLVPGGGHRGDEDLHVLGGVAEHFLPSQDRLVIGAQHVRRRGQVVQPYQRLAQPFAVRLLARDALFQFLVGNDAPFGGIDEEDASRLQPPLAHHLRGRDIEDADFGRHHDQVVARNIITRRP